MSKFKILLTLLLSASIFLIAGTKAYASPKESRYLGDIRMEEWGESYIYKLYNHQNQDPSWSIDNYRGELNVGQNINMNGDIIVTRISQSAVCFTTYRDENINDPIETVCRGGIKSGTYISTVSYRTPSLTTLWLLVQ